MRDVPKRLEAALADRYTLTGWIGAGGMATVYAARDRKHLRDVAVKVLRPELAVSVGPQRFLREIEIAARLTHPHIVPLFDSGEAGGFLYYVMPLIRGQALRQTLLRAGRLDLPTAISVARQVSGALQYAHSMGVLHRDIKPENILLADGFALVADFGVAKAITSAGGAAVTRTGLALGTPGYMSPEQAAGVRDVDGKTDVYGLACVVYEMLVGATPGLWPTDEAVRLGRFVDAPQAHRERLDAFPGRVEQVLVKALAMRPADRFTTPVQFANALSAAAPGSGGDYTAVEVRELVGRAVEMQRSNPTQPGVLSISALEEILAEVGIPPERVHEAMVELPELDGGPLDDTGIERVLRRAVALEERHSLRQEALSLGGVEQIAAQVGIAPERVRRVVDEYEPAAPTPGLFSGPAVLRVARSVDGEVPESELPAMVDLIHGALGTPGHVARLGKAMMWSRVAQAGAWNRNVQVTIHPSDGRTRIAIDERVSDLGRRVLGSVIGWVSGGLVGLGVASGLAVIDTSMAALFAIGFSAGGAYVVSRSMYVHQVTRRRLELERLADTLASWVSGAGGTVSRDTDPT